jgi:PAS domain S-box-containing protein
MITILYVDDEPSLLDIGKVFLERDGEFVVDTSASAEKALAFLGSRSYDAIISDFQMPGMDGIHFLKEIRKAGNTIPFIIFTGRGREEIVIQALNEGADFYLQKGGDPVSQFVELAHKVRLAVRQRRTLTALEKSEERYRAVVEDQTELICRFTPDGRLSFVNDAYCRYFSLERDRCLGGHHPVHLVPEDALQMKQHLAALTRESPAALIEHRIVLPDGTVRWQRWNDRAIFAEDGRVIEYQSVGRDITQHKQAEEALRESEEKYRTAIEKTREAVIIAQDGTFVFANASMGRLLGIAPEDLVGKPFIDFIWPDDRDLVATRYRQRMGGEDVPDIYEFRAIGAGGRMRWVSISAARIHWQGRPATINLLADITERRDAEQALRESEERFRAIFTSQQNGILIIDPADHRIVDVNPYICTLTGRPKERIVGNVCHAFVCPTEQGRCPITDLGQSVDNAERVLLAADGTRIPVLKTVVRVRLGGKDYLVENIQDITGRKRAETELAERQEKFSAAFTINPDPVAITEADTGRIIEANHAFSEWSGYSPDELIGRTTRELNFWVDPQERDAILVSLKAREDINDREVRFRIKNGAVGDCLFSARYISLGGKDYLFTRARDITERKRAEKLLKDRKATLTVLLNAPSDSIVLLDRQGTIIRINEAGAERLGGTVEAITGRCAWDLIPGEVGERRKGFIAQVFSGKKPVQFDDERSGFVIHNEIFPIFAADQGTVEHVAIFARDITGRRRAEEALRKSAGRMRSLLASMDDLVFVLDQNLVFREYYQPPGTEVYVGPESFMGRRFDDIGFPEPAHGIIKNALFRTLQTGDLTAAEFFLDMQGRREWFDLHVTLFRGESDTDAGLTCVVRNITGRKNAEEELKKSETLYRSILNASPDDITITDLEGRVTMVSPAAVRMFGYGRPEDLTGRSVFDFLVPGDRDRAAAILADLHRGILSPDREFRVLHADGHAFDVEVNADFIRNRDGTATGIVFVVRDITGRKKAESAVQ